MNKQKSLIQDLAPSYIIVTLTFYVLAFIRWRNREQYDPSINWVPWILFWIVGLALPLILVLYLRARRGVYSPEELDRLRRARMIAGTIMLATPFVVRLFGEFTVPLNRYLTSYTQNNYDLSNFVFVLLFGTYFVGGLFLVFLGRTKITGRRILTALIGSVVGTFVLLYFYVLLSFSIG